MKDRVRRPELFLRILGDDRDAFGGNAAAGRLLLPACGKNIISGIFSAEREIAQRHVLVRSGIAVVEFSGRGDFEDVIPDDSRKDHIVVIQRDGSVVAAVVDAVICSDAGNGDRSAVDLHI